MDARTQHGVTISAVFVPDENGPIFSRRVRHGSLRSRHRRSPSANMVGHDPVRMQSIAQGQRYHGTVARKHSRKALSSAAGHKCPGEDSSNENSSSPSFIQVRPFRENQRICGIFAHGLKPGRLCSHKLLWASKDLGVMKTSVPDHTFRAIPMV